MNMNSTLVQKMYAYKKEDGVCLPWKETTLHKRPNDTEINT